MNLPKVVTKSKKRRGQGAGSGKGFHTVGRGQKGQKSRGGIGILFEGMKTKKSLIHRLPFLRGKLKNRAHPKAAVVNLQDLNKLPDGSKVTIDLLVKAGLVNQDALKYGVKILGKGKLEKKLEIDLPMSKKVADSLITAPKAVVK